MLLTHFSEWCTTLHHMTRTAALLAIQLLHEEAVACNARESLIYNAISANLMC